MKKFTDYILNNIKGTITVILFSVLVVGGLTALAREQIDNNIEHQIKDSQTVTTMADEIIFNTNQDYYDMVASVLKQGEKLESDPSDLKAADIEYLTTECGLMGAWQSKGYDVTEQLDVCDLFNSSKTQYFKS